jgi:phosphate-selective porin
LYEDNRPEGFDIRPRTPLGFEFFPRIPTQGKRLALGGDFQWMHGPFSLRAEYIRNTERHATSNLHAVVQGWHLDVTYLITGENKERAMESGTELAARVEQLRVDAGSPITLAQYTDEAGEQILTERNHVTTLTLEVNYYLHYNMKFQFNVQNDWFGDNLFTPTSRTGPC